MFYDREKSREENRDQNERTLHNRNAFLFLGAITALATGVITLAIATNRAVKEFT